MAAYEVPSPPAPIASLPIKTIRVVAFMPQRGTLDAYEWVSPHEGTHWTIEPGGVLSVMSGSRKLISYGPGFWIRVKESE